MVELEDVDLAKALAVLSKRLARTAADMMIELDSPEGTRELAGELEEIAYRLRERALAAAPTVIDTGHVERGVIASTEHSGIVAVRAPLLGMTGWDGPATLVVGDTETAVTAHLYTVGGLGGLPSWAGSLECDDGGQAFWEAFNAGSARLRLPNGRECDVVVEADGEIRGGGTPLFED